MTSSEQPGAPTRFPFAFEPRMAKPAALFGVRPSNAEVVVEGGQLRIRFGPWSLATPVANVTGTTITGPYSFLKVAGPAHLSVADRGVTFATSTSRGLCVQFREPVAGGVPFGLVRHPGATVTVEDPEGLARALGHPV